MRINHDYKPPRSHEMHIPSVSIGMPVYNGENLIREALDSLLSQTFTDFELIISDNASTDATQVICQEYADRDSRIRYVRQQKNIGAFNNFEFVLDESRGNYFMWAAHDDLWMPTFISDTLHVLERSDRAACAVSKILFSDGTMSNATSSIIGSPQERLSGYLSDLGDNSRFYGLYRTERLRRAICGKKFDYHAGDWLIVAAIAIEGDILVVPDILMKRKCCCEQYKYFKHFAELSKWNLMFCFPFSNFSVHLLKHKEAWSMGTFMFLLKLNVGGHFYVAEMCGRRTYVAMYMGFLRIYRALRRYLRIIAETGTRG